MTYVDRQMVKFIASLHRVKDLHTAETKSGKRVINLHTRRDWDLQQKRENERVFGALARNITIDVRMMCTIKTNDVFSARCRQEGELVYKLNRMFVSAPTSTSLKGSQVVEIDKLIRY